MPDVTRGEPSLTPPGTRKTTKGTTASRNAAAESPSPVKSRTLFSLTSPFGCSCLIPIVYRTIPNLSIPVWHAGQTKPCVRRRRTCVRSSHGVELCGESCCSRRSRVHPRAPAFPRALPAVDVSAVTRAGAGAMRPRRRSSQIRRRPRRRTRMRQTGCR